MKTFVLEWGPVIVAVIALFGAVLTSIMANRRSKKNTERQVETALQSLQKQLESSEKNIQLQLKANKDLEIEKKKLELKQKYLFELKETVAKFIKYANILNKDFDTIHDYRNNGKEDLIVPHLIGMSDNIQNITDVYYSIKVSLDGSEHQKKLEALLDEYMTYTCFRDDLVGYRDGKRLMDTIGQIYHTLKAIIHENYIG